MKITMDYEQRTWKTYIVHVGCTCLPLIKSVSVYVIVLEDFVPFWQLTFKQDLVLSSNENGD